MTFLRPCLLGLTAAVLFSCAQNVQLERLQPQQDNAGTPNIVVVWSTANSLYQEPTRVFAEQLATDAKVWKVELGGPRRALKHAIEAKSPQLMVALGTQAALFAREEFPSVPTLFAMVVDYQRHPLLRGPNVMGIALEVPTHHEFTQFKIVIPGMDQVLAFYTEQTSQELLRTSRDALEELGIELVAYPVDTPGDIPDEFAGAAAEMDAVWLLNDPSIMTSDTFSYLRDATHRSQLPFLCSLSRQFTEHGALMSVSVNFGSLGFQAASMARSFLLEHTAPGTLGIQPPIGTEFVVNLATSEAIGLDIPPETYYVADEILNFEEAARASPGDTLPPDPDASNGSKALRR